MKRQKDELAEAKRIAARMLAMPPAPHDDKNRARKRKPGGNLKAAPKPKRTAHKSRYPTS
jgi:hypothetical protein